MLAYAIIITTPVHSPQSTAAMSKVRQSAKPMILSSLMQDNKLESAELHVSSVNQIGFRLLSLSKIGLYKNYTHA